MPKLQIKPSMGPGRPRIVNIAVTSCRTLSTPSSPAAATGSKPPKVSLREARDAAKSANAAIQRLPPRKPLGLGSEPPKFATPPSQSQSQSQSPSRLPSFDIQSAYRRHSLDKPTARSQARSSSPALATPALAPASLAVKNTDRAIDDADPEEYDDPADFAEEEPDPSLQLTEEDLRPQKEHKEKIKGLLASTHRDFGLSPAAAAAVLRAVVERTSVMDDLEKRPSEGRGKSKPPADVERGRDAAGSVPKRKAIRLATKEVDASVSGKYHKAWAGAKVEASTGEGGVREAMSAAVRYAALNGSMDQGKKEMMVASIQKIISHYRQDGPMKRRA